MNEKSTAILAEAKELSAFLQGKIEKKANSNPADSEICKSIKEILDETIETVESLNNELKASPAHLSTATNHLDKMNQLIVSPPSDFIKLLPGIGLTILGVLTGATGMGLLLGTGALLAVGISVPPIGIAMFLVGAIVLAVMGAISLGIEQNKPSYPLLAEELNKEKHALDKELGSLVPEKGAGLSDTSSHSHVFAQTPAPTSTGQSNQPPSGLPPKPGQNNE